MNCRLLQNFNIWIVRVAQFRAKQVQTNRKSEKERKELRIGRYAQIERGIVVQHYLTRWIYCGRLKPQQRKGGIDMMERTSDLHVTEQRTLNELINSKRMGGWKRLRKTLELAALLQAESGRGFIG